MKKLFALSFLCLLLILSSIIVKAAPAPAPSTSQSQVEKKRFGRSNPYTVTPRPTSPRTITSQSKRIDLTQLKNNPSPVAPKITIQSNPREWLRSNATPAQKTFMANFSKYYWGSGATPVPVRLEQNTKDYQLFKSFPDYVQKYIQSLRPVTLDANGCSYMYNGEIRVGCDEYDFSTPVSNEDLQNFDNHDYFKKYNE